MALDDEITQLRAAVTRLDGPLYRRLAEAIREAIVAGRLPPGARLPPERQLAHELRVSRVTAVAAYDVLREDGYLVRRQGSGTRVAPRPPNSDPWGGAGEDLAPSAVLLPGEMADLTGMNTAFTIAAMSGVEQLVGRTGSLAASDLGALIAGHGYAPAGYLPLREAIADRYTSRGLPTSPDEILVTSGAQQAISLLVSLLVGPDGTAVVEDPTYPGVLDALRAAGARTVAVPVDASGARPDILADQVRRWTPQLIYLVATHHNPTGVVLSPARRREILEIAGRTRTPIIDDLTLEGLSLDGSPEPEPLAAIEPSRMVITIGSLSKLIWGGLRVGWVRAPTSLIQRLTRLKLGHDHGSSLLSQGVATPLVGVLDDIAAERRREVRDRYETLTDSLRTHLPDWSWTRPSGGLSLWVRMPGGSASTIAELAARHGVTIVPGPAFSPSGNHLDRLRLPFGAPPEVIRDGISRLGAAWEEYLPLASRRTARDLPLVV